MPNKTRREYLTTDEVAAMLGVSVATVKRWAASGELPALRYGKLWRFEPADVKNRNKTVKEA